MNKLEHEENSKEILHTKSYDNSDLYYNENCGSYKNYTFYNSNDFDNDLIRDFDYQDIDSKDDMPALVPFPRAPLCTRMSYGPCTPPDFITKQMEKGRSAPPPKPFPEIMMQSNVEFENVEFEIEIEKPAPKAPKELKVSADKPPVVEKPSIADKLSVADKPPIAENEPAAENAPAAEKPSVETTKEKTLRF